MAGAVALASPRTGHARPDDPLHPGRRCAVLRVRRRGPMEVDLAERFARLWRRKYDHRPRGPAPAERSLSVASRRRARPSPLRLRRRAIAARRPAAQTWTAADRLFGDEPAASPLGSPAAHRGQDATRLRRLRWKVLTQRAATSVGRVLSRRLGPRGAVVARAAAATDLGTEDGLRILEAHLAAVSITHALRRRRRVAYLLVTGTTATRCALLHRRAAARAPTSTPSAVRPWAMPAMTTATLGMGQRRT